jgi:succinoglycan biosynthesis protein ExoV
MRATRCGRSARKRCACRRVVPEANAHTHQRAFIVVKLHSYTCEGGVTNFGDELNAHLWPRLLGDVLDDDASSLFVRIGTLLNDRLPPVPRRRLRRRVGYYGPPRRHDGWKVHCVRGPLSARALGPSADAAVTDPAY